VSHLGSALDKAILKKVNQHLSRMSLGSQGRVTATIANGQVVLSGTISYENQRRPALKAVGSVDGVRGVVDRLRVPAPKLYGRPSSPPSTNRSPTLDHPETNKPIALSGSPSPATASPPPKPPREQVELDDSKALAGYANFCRVMGTPEELIIDFGVNPQPFGAPTRPIAVTQRIVTNLYTAKRLLQVLQLTLQRHEATFGAIETDVQKRAQGGRTSG